MGNKIILLWLEAPLQSWGYDSKFNRRDTLEFPTKSGVLGMLLCALGASGEQKEFLSKLTPLRQTVISYVYKKNGKLIDKKTTLHDFQLVGAAYDENNIWENLLIPKKNDGSAPVGAGVKLTHRYYLQDAMFAVLIEVPDEYAEKISDALINPVYPIYLGRRNCIPTDFVYRGIYSREEAAFDALEDLLRKKIKTKDELENKSVWEIVESFRVMDGEYEEGDSFTLNDVPVQFGTEKKYRDRRVTKIYKEQD